MSKYLIAADNHFCTTSSVITKRGGKYSTRLENQIKSLEWVNSFGLPVIHLGDFFDKEVLTAEEISCLKEVKQKVDFSNWIFLQGNHGYSGGFDVLDVFDNQIISEPTEVPLDASHKCLFLPFKSKQEDIKEDYDIIFSHIGIEGIPFGAKGFDFEFIKSRCKMFLNGHLHNKTPLDHDKKHNYWNVGSLTAQNFSDECQYAEKGAWILDMSDLSLEFIENPYAFNFYKMNATDARIYEINPKLLPNACISVTCEEKDEAEFREKFKEAYYLRMNVQRSREISKAEEFRLTVDYLKRFKESYIKKNGESSIILDELAEVMR